MTSTLKPPQIQELLRRLKKAYGTAECALDHKNPFELLAATILSAQCTDKRVNLVTPALFARFPDPAAMARADAAEMEELVHTTGFFRNKAKSLIGMAKALHHEHDDEVPRTLEALIRLPGAARKTANVVLGVAYGIAVGVVVDTHVARLSARLGLTQHTDAGRIERDLMAVIPQKAWIDFSHMLIHHGRQVCTARSPKCDACTLHDLCPAAFVAGARVPTEPKAKPSKKATTRRRSKNPAG